MYMPSDYQIPLSQILLTIGRAVDLVQPSLKRHHEKVAWVSLRIAEACELSPKHCRNITYAALVHDIASIHIPDCSASSLRSDTSHIRHAHLGSRLIRTCGVLKHLAPLIEHHHVPYNELISDLSESEKIGTQIINIADLIVEQLSVNAYRYELKEIIKTTLKEASGQLYDPFILDQVFELMKCEAFWLQVNSYTEVHLHEELRARYLDQMTGWYEVIQLAHFFSCLIDMRSPFTASHSASVASVVRQLSIYAGFSKQETEEIYVAGYLHDVGKVAVPLSILDKPGPLNNDERLIMDGHTFYTRYILQSLPGCEKIISWAANHHETLDGEGYPYRIDGDQLSAGSRLMAVADIFTALLEDRPYRDGMSKDRVISILQGAVSNRKISKRYYELTLDNYTDLRLILKETEVRSRRKFNNFWLEASTGNPAHLVQPA